MTSPTKLHADHHAKNGYSPVHHGSSAEQGTWMKGIWVLVAAVLGSSVVLGLVFLHGAHKAIHQDITNYVATLTSKQPEQPLQPQQPQQPATPGYKCTTDMQRAAARQFKTKQTLKGLTCAPDTIWIDAIRDATGPGPLVMLDVGCNKGYFSAELFNAFMPEAGMNKLSLWQTISETEPFNSTQIRRCATCDATHAACTEVPASPPSAPLNRSLIVHCFEASSVNFRRLVSIKQGLMKRLGVHMMSAWPLHRLPLSRQYESVLWTTDCEGTQCSLSGAGSKAGQNLEIVQASSIDDFVRLHLPDTRISLLKIDAEGYDPEIMKGAMNLIKSGKLDVLFFEYHKLATWKDNPLPDMVTRLEQQGMVCYFVGVGDLFKLSRGCWAAAYEVKQWSNVVCGAQNSWAELTLDRISWLYKSGAVKEDSAAAAATAAGRKLAQ